MIKFNPKVGDLVYFRWEDHVSYDGSGWRSVRDILRTTDNAGSLNETVGFVIAISRTHITTVAHINVPEKWERAGDEDASHVSTRIRKTIVQGKIIQRFKS